MIKVYLPINKKVKSNVRGLWQDNRKIYYDYLTVNYYQKVSNNYLEALKVKHNQICLFGIDTLYNRAFIYYSNEKIEYLNKKTELKIHKKNAKRIFKSIVKKYGGLTIYNEGNFYKVEIWSN